MLPGLETFLHSEVWSVLSLGAAEPVPLALFWLTAHMPTRSGLPQGQEEGPAFFSVIVSGARTRTGRSSASRTRKGNPTLLQ